MNKKLVLGLGFAFALIQNNVQAQKSSSLSEVVVQENRIKEAYGKQNRNIEILDSKQIKTLPVKTVNELLSYVAGVDLRQRGPISTQADIAIDGSTFDQVLVLVNGVKMTDPQTGHHTMNLPIPLSAIDHIEIVRGPAARTYGINALAGAVNIVTKLPQDNEVFAQAYSGSSFQTDSATGETYLGWGVQASAALAGKNQSHILSVAHDEGNGYRHNTDYNAYRLFYQNQFVLNKKNSIEAMGGYINNDFGANAFYAAPADAESTEKVQTAIGSIRYNFKPSDKVTISPRVSYRYNNDDYIFVKQKPSLYHNIHETNIITGEVQSIIKLGKGILGAGVEYRNAAINSTNLGKRTRVNIGTYTEYKHYFSQRFNAGAGLYVNWNAEYGWEFFPGVDLGYFVADKVKLFANATMGQRLPTYTDLYYKGPVNIGNAQLQPEYAKYAEGGVQYDGRLLFAKAAYFFRNSTDFIDWVKANATDPWQPQNFQEINTNGVTAQLIYQLSKHMDLSDNYEIAINGNYTYLSPMINVPNNNLSRYAINALRHQATVKVTSTLFKHVQANVAYRYLYRINANDYTVLDARVGYTFKDILIYIDVNNILDTQYREITAVPMPGRWMTFGVRFNPVWK